jgi:hypothetical protein
LNEVNQPIILLKRLNIAKEKLNSIFMAVMPGWGK